MCISQLVDGSVDIELEVFVNRSTAPKLNCGKEKMEDILVLHLERGKDYFISVMGNYLPSCYGSSIHSLCQLREPIQDMPQETLRRVVSGLTHSERSPLNRNARLSRPSSLKQCLISRKLISK